MILQEYGQFTLKLSETGDSMRPYVILFQKQIISRHPSRDSALNFLKHMMLHTTVKSS